MWVHHSKAWRWPETPLANTKRSWNQSRVCVHNFAACHTGQKKMLNLESVINSWDCYGTVLHPHFWTCFSEVAMAQLQVRKCFKLNLWASKQKKQKHIMFAEFKVWWKWLTVYCRHYCLCIVDAWHYSKTILTWLHLWKLSRAFLTEHSPDGEGKRERNWSWMRCHGRGGSALIYSISDQNLIVEPTAMLEDTQEALSLIFDTMVDPLPAPN